MAAGGAVPGGLTTAEAVERFAVDGPNELSRPRRRSPFRIAVEVLREPMLAMLLAAGGVYLLLGSGSEAAILVAFAGFSIVVTMVQEARTERVLDALRDLSAPRALVLRDGVAVRVPGREVCRGDVLLLEQGDRVAADALLIEAAELEADESLLTGESVPVRKRAGVVADTATGEPGGDDQPSIFAGSILTHGRGMARVTATGATSRMGQIGVSLATLDVEAPQLRRETGRVVRLCAIGGVGVALLVVLLFGLLRGGWLAATLAGIAIGMSMLPEEFPVVLTVFLAMGAWRIARVGVLTRRAAAIETLGSATVLCADKTGTLTQNQMVLSELWTPGRGIAAMAGGLVGIDYVPLVRAAALASAPVPIDPMEKAFHEADRALGVDPSGSARRLVHSYALRPELLAMSNVWAQGTDASLLVAAKGAPEAVAQLCRLPPDELAALHAAAQAMAERGGRVLGVASARIGPDDLGKAHEEHDFTLSGLVGLADPLRPGVAEAVAECRAAGLRVVMITGDYAATARAIGQRAGLAEGKLVTGVDVAAWTDAELAGRIGDVTIFARTQPAQKLKIVTALKAAGEVVAMTGDGVNDAPALKAAHIGIAMGKRGTDVAREAASIVLVEDDFGAIVAAIRLGRRIYDNIRKAMSFIFGAHVPIAGLALLPLLSGLPVVLGPIQIALLEMIIDPICALAFEAEPEEEDLMRRAPRAPGERLFSTAMVGRSVLEGAVALVAVAVIYLWSAGQGLPAAELRTVTFLSLVAALLALTFADRSFSTSMRRALLRHNPAFRYILVAIAVAVGAILWLGPFQRLFQFAPLTAAEILSIPLIGMVLLSAFEMIKRFRGPTVVERRPAAAGRAV